MTDAGGGPARPGRSAPLLVKLLAPFVVLLLVVGTAGLFLVVRDLSSRARAQLNQQLLLESLDARSRLHDRELYLLESADFAANLEAMAPAVRAHDARAVTILLQSVQALKTDLGLLAITDGDGTVVGDVVQADEAIDAGDLVVRAVAANGHAAALVTRGDDRYLTVATAICSGRESCAPVGVALAGMRLDALSAEIAGRVEGGLRGGAGARTVAMFDRAGNLLTASGRVATTRAPSLGGEALVRRNDKVGDDRVATAFAPLSVQTTQLGVIGVTIPSGPSLAIARSAGTRLALLLLAAMAAVVGVGAALARSVLAQVRPLVRTSRALGGGDLDARSPVVSGDELGELAVVLNQMADQLQASHTTLERSVEERTQAIRELLTERTELFTGISHELRTPVAIILSEARMMLDPTYGKPSARAEGAHTIVASAEQLLERVNQILELARMESGRVDVDLVEVSLPELLAELAPTLDGLASAGELSLHVDVPAGTPAVSADPSRLKDAVLNLVSNAVKYTPAGGSIRIGAAQDDRTVRIAVSDTGVGIPLDIGERVFEPFFRVPGIEPERDQPSSGLGLALVRRLVEAQGGTVSYTSEPGTGSTFTLSLPAVAPARRRRATTANAGR